MNCAKKGFEACWVLCFWNVLLHVHNVKEKRRDTDEFKDSKSVDQ